jgi:stress response protein YsnF
LSAKDARAAAIPLFEEALRIDKTVNETDRVFIRTSVLEKTELAERRPVDRPADIAAETAEPFRERTIEVAATAEEAVVSKEARVKEEVVVGKDAEERTETVSDTVRRTEVEVEDERAKAPAAPPNR